MTTRQPERNHDDRVQALEAVNRVLTEERDFENTVDELLVVASDAIGTDYATLSRVHQDAGEYLFERVISPPDAPVDAGDTVALERLPSCAHVVETEETLVLQDVDEQAPSLSHPDFGIATYLGAPVTVDGDVYGTFCFYGTEPRDESFSTWHVTLVEFLADWVSRELARERYVDRIAALNDLYGAVQNISTAVIDRSTREEIEATACESLAAVDPNVCAWIGEADPATDSLHVRESAGTDSPIAADGRSIRSEESAPPPIRTLRTETVQRWDHASVDTAGDDWTVPGAAENGAGISVPVVHDESVYGVLTVHATCPDAFEGQERTIMRNLGEFLGHAIASIERKQALTSDVVIELAFRITDVLDAQGSADPPRETIQVDELLALGDGRMLAYGRTPQNGFDAVTSIAEGAPSWDDVSSLSARDDEVYFEARLTEPPFLSSLASLDGQLEEVVIENGDLVATVHVPPDLDPRRAVEELRGDDASVEVASKRQITRPERESRRLTEAVTEELTDRQLQTLRVAYYAGYFERPRDVSGAEISDRLDITNATFSQHLRAAQTKLFDALFEE